MTTIYNLESGVVPGVRVDGISIGQSIDDIGLDAGLIQDANGQKFAYLLDGAIFIAFQNDGIVFQISAANGYKGAA